MFRPAFLSKIITLIVVVTIAIGLLPVQQVNAQGSVQTPYVGMWLTANELAALPTSGAAWDALVRAANTNAGSPDVQNQDSNNDVYVLAKALVFARTGDARYRSEVIDNLKRAVGTERGGRTLALGRNLVSYVISADLVNLPKADPSFDGTFRNWLRTTLTENLDGRTLVSTHNDRPNNWGTHAGASRAAVALYLGDRAELDKTAMVFKGWMGDRNAYASFSYGALDWQCDTSKPVGINPKGCVKNGKSIDGAQPEEMRRGGGFQFPPAETGYPWEALQGAMVQAQLLNRAGYPAFQWNDAALLRAVNFLHSIGWYATGDDAWQVWLINYAYGTKFSTSTAGQGKNMGWTDWTHQKYTAPGGTAPQPQQPTPVPVQPTAVPVQPTAVPVQPTAVPVQPTAVPVQPTAVPVQPTAVPVQPTAVPVQPTAAPVQPTAVPAQPTLVAPPPTSSGLIKMITFENGNLKDGTSGTDRVSGNVALAKDNLMKGSYSASFANVTDTYLQEDFNATGDVDVTFYFYANTLPSKDVRILLISNDGNTVGNLLLRTNGALRLRSGSDTIGESAPLAAKTVYMVRLHQTSGGVLEAFVAPNGGQFGGAFAAITNGGWGSPATFVRFGATASGALDGRFDDIQIIGR